MRYDGTISTLHWCGTIPMVPYHITLYMPFSLFSQYTLTATGVASGTAYALVRKPRNGIGIMIVAGAAGTMGDLLYGWMKACRPQVEAWRQAERAKDE